MRGVIGSILVLVLLRFFTVAAQLPPEIMADRYLVRVERLMAENNHTGALEVMNKIIALQKEHNLTLPDEFHFKYAQIAFSAGSTKDAIESLNKYLVVAGREGQFYRQALELLDEAEQKQAEQEKIQAAVDQYLVEAERLIAEKNDKAAVDLVNQLLNLGREHDLTLPNEFHFVVARVALSVGRFKLAQDSANQYLSAAGASGKYSGEVQELLEEMRAAILPEMVVIPRGRFQMGCVSGKNCQDDEKPVHEVTVASFALSKYEVTFAEYDRFTAATGRKRADDEGWGRGRRPVINVSWEDAVAYTEWLSAKLGEHYRLPSEAEWEYAARAGSTTKYSWGNKIGHNRANCDGCGSQWDNEKAAQVGSFSPNAWGLHDMHGNVWEWVQDCWNKRYQGAPADGSAWKRSDCSRRVIRGGSWFARARDCRSAGRAWLLPGYRSGRLGFRLLRTE